MAVHSISLSLSLSLSQDAGKRKTAKAAIEELAKTIKFEVLGWRVVPVKPAVLGKLALENSPWVEQLVLKSTQGLKRDLACVKRDLVCVREA
jgi:glutamate synthase (ferredoxin)